MGTDVEQFENSRLILIWGSNPVTSNLHLWTRVQEAKRRGASSSPSTPTAARPRRSAMSMSRSLPGTDAALALGMMHVLIADDLVDHDYIARHTLGFDGLRERAADYPPERVAQICGIAARNGDPIGAGLRHSPAGGDPRELRDAAPRRRRQRHTRGGLPARAGRRLAGSAAGGALLSSSGTIRSMSRRSNALTSSGARRERST